MDLKNWKCFCAVAEAGSLSRAAQSLEIAQSALSRQIGMLEDECGALLFHRTGRGVVLTTLGEVVRPKARALLEAADRLEDRKGGARHSSGHAARGLGRSNWSSDQLGRSDAWPAVEEQLRSRPRSARRVGSFWPRAPRCATR